VKHPVDGNFVPHNLISAQESSVPLPKFQMAPRLKILISSGPKKGTQIYYPFSQKVLASKSPPGSPAGPLWKELSLSRDFSTCSPGTPARDPSLHIPFTELP